MLCSSRNRCAPHRALDRKNRARLLARSLAEGLEPRMLLSSSAMGAGALASPVRAIDESNNNLANSNWGTANTDLLRLAPAAYSDGISAPSLPTDQSARSISNILNNQADPLTGLDYATVDQNSVSDFGYAFGQFMDHDMDLTPTGTSEMDIPVSANDPIGPNGLPFFRSITDPSTGTSTSNPAQQVNVVTSYLDLSQVYGSTQVISNALRTFQGGLLKTSPGNMLPYDNTDYFTTAQIAALNMANDAQAVPESQLFAAGDVRANENIELTTLQTLFVRNHNRVAAQLQKLHPKWTDEQLYQEARKLNIAEYQSIIYNEWIPTVLGTNALPRYTGYKANVDAAISNEFSTVAFRFGHSMVSGEIERQNNDGSDLVTSVPEGADISLAEDFFDPNLLNPSGAIDPLTGLPSSDIGPILKAEADGIENQVDLLAINDIRNLLFGNGGLGGDDLMARDVQRDRDNGIPDYNTLRAALGLPAVTSFSQITSNVQAQQALEAAYPGGVNTIDAFEGGLAADHVAGSDVGSLFQKIMVDQFTRLRNGDRFFYLNENFTSEEMSFFQRDNTLAEVIESNTSVTNLQSDVFLFKASISGAVTTPTGSSGGFGRNRQPSSSGVAGITVQLLNGDGEVVATTTTDRLGRYSFNQLSVPAANADDGPGLSGAGTYSVALVLPTGGSLLSGPKGSMTISRGDVNLSNVNFSIKGIGSLVSSVVNAPGSPLRTPMSATIL